MYRSKLVLALVATLASALTASQSYAQSFSTLASFNGTNGANPQGSLTLSGSTLYGITPQGGAYGEGTIFSIPVTGGTPTTLLSFNGTNGGDPQGSLTLSGSTLYGMTYLGGVNGLGTIFSIPVTGGAPTTLLSFNGTTGAYPLGSLTLSADGSTLYGATSRGGTSNEGTIFSIPVTGGTPTTLQSFNGTNGADPQGSLTLSADGSTLYGMTEAGGANIDGTIFSIPVTGGPLTTMLSFNGTNGIEPVGSLTLSADGSTLYGTTLYGGPNNNFDLGADGNIFSIPTTGGAVSTLFNFYNVFNDIADAPFGRSPTGSLTLSADGSTLYGMAYEGGYYNAGTLFSVPLAGGDPTVLVNFNSTSGTNPGGGLTPSADGSTLYGMTSQGGANGDGTVFALSTPEPSSVVLLGLGTIGFGAMALPRRMRERAI